MFCTKCGKEIQTGTNFCPNCGYKIGIINEAESTDFIATQEVVSNNNVEKDSAGTKIGISYVFSILSAVISFFIRVSMQQEYISWDSLIEGKEILGLTEDIKPFCTIVPIIAIIIVSLLIISSKKASAQKKAVAFIWNGVFIALSLLFIWFDIIVRFI